MSFPLALILPAAVTLLALILPAALIPADAVIAPVNIACGTLKVCVLVPN